MVLEGDIVKYVRNSLSFHVVLPILCTEFLKIKLSPFSS